MNVRVYICCPETLIFFYYYFLTFSTFASTTSITYFIFILGAFAFFLLGAVSLSCMLLYCVVMYCRSILLYNKK